MPTCWNDSSLGDDNDHKSHMAYTTDGEVNGPCPSGFGTRVPQVQLFVRIIDSLSSISDSYSILDSNQFTGSIPSEVGNLTKLEELYFRTSPLCLLHAKKLLM